MNDERAQGFWKMLSLNAFWGKAMKSGSQFGPHLLFHWLCEEFQQLVVVDQCMSAIKTHCNNYMARLEPCHCCPDCNYNYCYKTETTAVEPTHLDYLIDEAHMSDRVSLLHQNLLQMLHLKNMQQRNLHTIFISLADRMELRFWCVNEQSVTIWTVSRHTCLHAAHIWSISFSRLVHRAARKAAVLPGVGSTALPGAPGGRRQLIALFLLFRWEKMR